MSSKDPADPRPDSQVEAEEANAAEEPRQLVAEGSGGSRDAEAASAAEYEKAGIMGAPGSEVFVAGGGAVVHTDEGTAAAGKGTGRKS